MSVITLTFVLGFVSLGAATCPSAMCGPPSCGRDYVFPYRNTSVPDYYWRDYTGEVPNDAVQGGYDANGNPTYIGQVLYPKTRGLLPAILSPPNKAGLSTAEVTAFTYDVYVTILCSQNRNRLYWEPTTSSTLDQVGGRLVRGGTEIDEVIYIGRANFENKLLVGKVFDKSRGLWVPNNAGTPTQINTFQILTYV